MARFKEQRHPRSFDVEIYVTFVGTAVAVAAKIPVVAPPPPLPVLEKEEEQILLGTKRFDETP